MLNVKFNIDTKITEEFRHVRSEFKILLKYSKSVLSCTLLNVT